MNKKKQAVSPCIRLKRVVHVKDDDERATSVDRHQLTLNMAQATERMMEQTHLVPKIILKRVEFDRC